GCSQNAAENADELLPLDAARVELALSLRRQPIDAPPGAAPAAMFGFPNRLDLAGGFEPVQGWVQRPLLEPQQPASGLLQPAQDPQAVRLAPLQRGQDHRFEMAAQLVAVDRFHPFILDRLGIDVNGASVPSAKKVPPAVQTALRASVSSSGEGLSEARKGRI